MKFRTRRFRNISALIVAALLVILSLEIIELSLQVQQYYSGWFLILLFVILFAFYIKKRLSIVPLGSSSAWAQWHYYLGFFSIVVFLKHINFSIPAGRIELVMTILFLIVLLSGFSGLLISRLFAKRLSYLEEEVIYERIPEHIRKLKEEVEALVLDCVEQSGSTTLSEYYVSHLADYFYRPRFMLRHLFGSTYAVERILVGLQNQIRYLSKEEVDYALELKSCIQRKSTLDIHYALQGALKHWGISHLPVALALFLFVGLHIVLVYAFRGAV